MRVLAVAVVLVCIALPGSRATASGQTVVVEVLAAGSGEPVVGAFVSLLDDHGRVLRSGLTNTAGRLLLPVSPTGTFRVRAEMIGRETRASPPFTPTTGPTRRISLFLPPHAIPLTEIRVETDERCRLRPEEASEIARVWEEARKALAVQTWTEREGLYRLEISSYERDLDARGRRVVRESRREVTAVTRTPFASLPVEELERTGFVRPLQDGGHEYFGPDAAVLLSDPFLDTHCLRLERSAERPGSIGLAFEPVQAGERPDIRGTMWVEEGTARLSFLEYSYDWAPYPEARGLAGGRVEFEAMPNGAWIIDRWWIRAPVMGQRLDMARAGDSGIRVAGIRETGGEVVGISTLARRTISETPRGALRGVVWDSTRSGPLEGATVRLSGTPYAADTGTGGRFLLEGLPPGVYTAGFRHPRLDSLGVEAVETEVEIVAGADAEVRLAVPSRATMLEAACRSEEEGEEETATLSGTVRDGTSGEPLPGARVRVEWQEVGRVRPVVQAEERWLEVRTDARGRYAACGIPLDEALRVRASFMDVDGDATEVGFDVGERRALDLEVELPPGLFGTGADRASAWEGSGTQGVQGLLVDPESGGPVRAAEVSLRDPSGRVLVSGVTDQRGFFRLLTPTPGPYLLSGSALGYEEVSNEAVSVESGSLTVLEIRMAPAALEIEPLVVTAEARSFHLEMQGFYEREAHDLGVFITPEILEERRPRRATDLFFRLAGTRVLEPSTGIGGRAVYFRSGLRPGGQICWPMVYVDRHLVSTGGLPGAGAEPTAVDDVVDVSDILAMEIYRSPAEIPSGFNGPNAGCGVVVIWTRRGRGG